MYSEYFYITFRKINLIIKIVSNLNQTHRKQKLQPSRKPIEKLTEKEHSKLSFEQPLNDIESPDEIVNRLIDTTKTLSERQKNYFK